MLDLGASFGSATREDCTQRRRAFLAVLVETHVADNRRRHFRETSIGRSQLVEADILTLPIVLLSRRQVPASAVDASMLVGYYSVRARTNNCTGESELLGNDIQIGSLRISWIAPSHSGNYCLREKGEADESTREV